MKLSVSLLTVPFLLNFSSLIKSYELPDNLKPLFEQEQIKQKRATAAAKKAHENKITEAAEEIEKEIRRLGELKKPVVV